MVIPSLTRVDAGQAGGQEGVRKIAKVDLGAAKSLLKVSERVDKDRLRSMWELS